MLEPLWKVREVLTPSHLQRQHNRLYTLAVDSVGGRVIIRDVPVHLSSVFYQATVL